MATPESVAAWVGTDPLRMQARDWVDRVNAATGMSGGWRLQVMSLRTRRDFRGDGESGDGPETGLVAVDGSRVYSGLGLPPGPADCTELPARIRRFVSGCPWPILDQVVRYLYATAPYEGIVFNGVRSGGVYRPTLTQWTRDAQSQVGNDATYTLVQDLVEVTECRDELAVATGESCLQVESTTYRWDEPSVEPPEALGPCAQGETSSVQAVRRNEDGTFDYQLVRTVARTRYVPPHAVACDAAHRAVEARWENLYGSPGAWEARGATCGDVPLAGLPAASCASAADGVRVSWDVQLNRDCTYSVSRREVSAVELSAEWTDGTKCRPVSHEEVRGSASRPRHGAPSAAGVRVDMRVQRDDDGTWQWTRSESEAPASESVEWSDGSPCRPRETVHAMDVRSKSAALAYVPRRAPGRTVDAQVSRNEDCTWDVRASSTESPAADVVEWSDGSPCRPRSNRHAMNVANKSAAVARVHARTAGAVVDARVSRNEDCTWDVVSTSTQSASAWDWSWTEGSRTAPVKRSVWQAQRAVPAAAVAAPAPRQTVDASLRRNEDCTYDASRTVRERARGAATYHEGSACRPTTTTRRWAQDSWTTARPNAGETVSMSVQRNDDGTYDVTRSVTTRKGVAPASWTEGTSCRPVSVTQAWGASSVPRLGTPDAGQSVSMSVQRNDDCTYDYVQRVRLHRNDASFGWTDGVLGVSTTSHVVQEGLAAAPSVSAGTVGRTVRATVRRDEDCTYSSETAVTVTSPAGPLGWVEGSSCRPVNVKAWWGQPSVPSALQAHPARGHDVAVSVQRNGDGTYDAVRRDREPMASDGGSWTDGSVNRAVDHQLYSHSPDLPSVAPATAPGTVVHAGFSRGDDCTYSGQVETVWSTALSGLSWQDGNSCVPSTTTEYSHVQSVPSSASAPVPAFHDRRSSWRYEDDGTYSGTVTERDYSSLSGPEVYKDTWQSVEEAPAYKYTYECGILLFQHVPAAQIPKPRAVFGYKPARVSFQVHMEDDCTFSGVISAQRLVRWETYKEDENSTREFTRADYMVYDGTLYTRNVKYRLYTRSGATEVVNEGPWREVSDLTGG